MGLLKTLLVIIVISYIIRILRYYLTPIFKLFITRKVEQQFRNRYNNSSNQKTHETGETIIDKMPNNKKPNDSVGEYVDYEEIE
jgi:hypothetical protein